jgi:hypothetical protein
MLPAIRANRISAVFFTPFLFQPAKVVQTERKTKKNHIFFCFSEVQPLQRHTLHLQVKELSTEGQRYKETTTKQNKFGIILPWSGKMREDRGR